VIISELSPRREEIGNFFKLEPVQLEHLRALDRVDSAWYGTPRSTRPPSLACSLGGS